MSRGFRKASDEAPTASVLVKRALAQAGWIEVAKRSAYEVPPSLVWPITAGGVGCRILGVPTARLANLGIPGGQGNLAGLFCDHARMNKVLSIIRRDMCYRIGGCWHFVRCLDSKSNWANLQRLESWAFLEAAALPWQTLRDHLESGLELAFPINNTARQKVTPTGRAESVTVPVLWDQLVEGPISHWTTGLGYGDGYSDSGVQDSVLVRAESLAAAPGHPRPGHQIVLSPLAVALAVGLRGRVHRQAGSDIYHEGPIQEVRTIAWKMEKPARQLLLHTLAAATPGNPDDGPCAYLDDPWLLSAMLGAKTKIMNANNVRDLRIRRSRAASDASEAVESTRVEGFVRRTLNPLRPMKVIVGVPMVETIPLKDHEGSQDALTRETTPIPNDQSVRAPLQDTPDLTGRHQTQGFKTPWRHGIRTLTMLLVRAAEWVIASFRTKEIIRKLKTLPAPNTPTQLGDIEARVGEQNCEDPITLGEGHTWNCEKRLRGKAPSLDLDINGISNQVKQVMSVPTQCFEPRHGVVYCIPGECRPSGEHYELPLGSRRDVPPDDIAALRKFLASHPDLEERLSVDAVIRILSFLPSTDSDPISAEQLIPLLQSASTSLRREHLDDLLRIIDTVPDGMIRHKPRHVAFAIESPMVQDIWLGWHTRTQDMKDWTQFRGQNPYTVTAGKAWREKANPEVRLIESAAKAFSDWWVISSVDPVIDRLPASDREIRPLVQLVDVLRGAWTPFDCGHAMAALSGSTEFHAVGRRADRFWRRLRIDPTQIIGNPMGPGL